MSSLPDMDWGPSSPGTGASTPLYGLYGGGSRSMASLAMDGERIVEEIDRVMMQTHSVRGKILKQTSQVLEKYKEDDARSTKELKDLPDSLDKYEELVTKKRMRRKLKREARAVLSDLLQRGQQSADPAADHSLNFHLAKHNPAMQGTYGSELPSVLEEDDEDDNGSSSFSFFAPLPSDTLAATDTRYLPPKSRKAKKLFNSRPAAGPASVAPHEQGELERRHRCRRQIFDLLQQARDEEERLQQRLDECERSVRLAPDDASHRQAAQERSRLYRALATSRKQAVERVEDFYHTYQPRVPTSKEDETLRVLEKELKLTTLADVYQEVSSTLTVLAESDARREAELRALMPDQESGERMVFGDDDGEDGEYGEEEYGEDEEQYDYEEYEYEEEEDGGYGDDEDFEDDGEQQQPARGAKGRGGGSPPEKATRKGKVMVLEPRALDRAAGDAKAAAQMAKDPSVVAGIQELPVVRPVTDEGTGIQRGVRGRVQDNTSPIDGHMASLEMYHRDGLDQAAYYMPGYAPPKVAVATANKVGPPWLEARREIQRSHQQEGRGGGEGKEEEGGEEEKAGRAVRVHGESKGEEARSPASAKGAKHEEEGDDASTTTGPGGDLISRSDSLMLAEEEEEAARAARRRSVLTRGTKIGEHNVLVRLYPGELEGELDVSAFDPATQDCYARALNRHEAKRLLGDGARLDEEGIRQAGPAIIAALRLQPTGPGGSMVLEVDIP